MGGCSPLKHQFECGRDVGVTCKSLGDVDALVEEGALHTPLHETEDLPHVEKNLFLAQGDGSSNAGGTDIKLDVKRIPEEVATLWFAAHETVSGDYEGESVRYVVMRPARWDVFNQSKKV